MTVWGPGTVTLTVGAGTPASFEQEVKSATVHHDYEDVGESVTYLNGDTIPAGVRRVDSVDLECDFDLGSAGFYAFLDTNDLATATISYTPNTAAGGSWTGSVRLQLPAEAGADEYGGQITGTVTLPAIGLFSFAAGT